MYSVCMYVKLEMKALLDELTKKLLCVMLVTDKINECRNNFIFIQYIVTNHIFSFT